MFESGSYSASVHNEITQMFSECLGRRAHDALAFFHHMNAIVDEAGIADPSAAMSVWEHAGFSERQAALIWLQTAIPAFKAFLNNVGSDERIRMAQMAMADLERVLACEAARPARRGRIKGWLYRRSHNDQHRSHRAG